MILVLSVGFLVDHRINLILVLHTPPTCVEKAIAGGVGLAHLAFPGHLGVDHLVVDESVHCSGR